MHHAFRLRPGIASAGVRLELRTPGRASFTVPAKSPLKGLVTLDIGYNDKPLQRFFIGYVERSTSVNAVEQVLFCRELAAILSQPLPLNLRHVDLRAVLTAISNKTGLTFRVPDQPYAKVKAPFFYNLATGIQAMDSLARVFSIPTRSGSSRATAKSLWAVGPTAFLVPGSRCSCQSNCSTATRATKAPWSPPCQAFALVQPLTRHNASFRCRWPRIKWV